MQGATLCKFVACKSHKYCIKTLLNVIHTQFKKLFLFFFALHFDKNDLLASQCTKISATIETSDQGIWLRFTDQLAAKFCKSFEDSLYCIRERERERASQSKVRNGIRLQKREGRKRKEKGFTIPSILNELHQKASVSKVCHSFSFFDRYIRGPIL